MLKYIETTGRNEDDAIAAALSQLGLERDDVSVEIIGRAKAGFLGIGSTPAKVRVSYEVPDEVPQPVKAEIPVTKSQPVKTEPYAAKPPEQKKQSAVPLKRPAAASEPSTDQDEVSIQITSFLDGLFQHMEISAQAVVTHGDEESYDVVLEGENLGSLIGRRGETLDAIQQLTGYAVNHTRSKRVRIRLDAENYRAKREEALQRLAEKTAARVVKYRRNVTLEAMNAYERHVIHAALQEVPNISTYSTGVEPHRRTVVAFSPEK
ncbi:MAG: R-binding protein Jag [Oscillospiraceae bacterium]|nr:R-binding protein Jag [Oscillospiraceae bacterium]